MARRKSVNFVRDIGVDERFESAFVQKFINVVMWRGKKNAARKIVYEAIDTLIKRAGGDQHKGLTIFLRAIEQVTPSIEVKARRVGGGRIPSSC